MITPKQRAELKALANSIEPTFQVGKGGVNDAQAAQIDDYLRVHELGSKAILYKRNEKEPVIKLKNK